MTERELCWGKLAFDFPRYISLENDLSLQNKFCGEVMLVISSIIHLGKSGLSSKAMTDDDFDRMMLCLQVSYWVENNTLAM